TPGKDGKVVPVPAYVTGAAGCQPAGPGCSMEAHSSGSVNEQDPDQKHIGSANSDCSGGAGTCSTAAMVAYDKNTGQVQASSDCQADGTGTCTRSEAHSEAWARSPDGTLSGQGKSDCARTSGNCSTVAVAKYYPATTQKQDGKDVPVPPRLEAGSNCQSDSKGQGCSFSFSANGKQTAKSDNGKQEADAAAHCGRSGATGGGGCSIVANATVDENNGQANAAAACEGDASCSYSAHAKATDSSDKNNADSVKDCGANKAGSCSLGVSAKTGGGDDARQGASGAAGYCTDSNNSCRGEFRAHADSNRDTLSDCHSGGNGYCNSEAAPDHAKSTGNSDQTLFMHSKAPGEESTKQLPGDKTDQVLNANTHKSPWGFFKNLARDTGSTIAGAPAGIVHLVWSIPVEVFNTFKYDVFRTPYPDRAPGEGNLSEYSKVHPLTGGLGSAAVGLYDHLLKPWVTWDWSKTGNDYYFAPVSTLLQDLTIPSLAAFGVGLILKGLSAGALAGGTVAEASAATTGLRGAAVSMGLRVAQIAPKLADAGEFSLRWGNRLGNVAFAPYKLWFAAGRLTASAASRFVLAPTTAAVFRGAEAAFGRTGPLENGTTPRFAPLWNATGEGLTRTGVVLDNVTYATRTIGQSGLPGLLATYRAYRTLGTNRAATPEELTAAYQAAHARAADRNTGDSPSLRSRVLGNTLDTTLRQNKVDRAAGQIARDYNANSRLNETTGRPGTTRHDPTTTAPARTEPTRGTGTPDPVSPGTGAGAAAAGTRPAANPTTANPQGLPQSAPRGPGPVVPQGSAQPAPHGGGQPAPEGAGQPIPPGTQPAALQGAEPAITPEGAPHGTSQGTPRVAPQGEHATAPPPLPRGTAAGTPQGTRGAGEGPPATPERIPTPAAPAGAAPAARPGGEPPGPGIQPSPAKPAVTAADHPANPGTQPAQPANQGSGHNNSGPHPGPRPTDPPPGSMPPAVPATGGVRTGSTKDSGDGGTPMAGPSLDPGSGAPKPATTAATEQGPGKPADTFVTAPKRGPPPPEGSPTSAAGKPGSAPGSEAPGDPAAPENGAGPNGVSVERPVTGKQGQEPTPAPNNEQNVPSHAGDQGTGTPGAAEPAGAQPADATVRNTESGTPGRPGQPKADDQPTSGDRPDSSSATRETTADAPAADTPLIERIHQEMRGSRGVLSVRELATRLGVKKHQVRAAVEGDTHFAGAEHAAQFGTARYLVVQDSGQAFVLRPVRGAAEQRSVTASEGAGEGEGQRTGSAKEGGLASDGIVVDRGATSGTATAGKPGDPRPALWERIAGLQSKLSDARAAQVEQRAAANALHTERADLVTELVGRRAAELLKRPSGGEPALPGPTELPSLDFGAGRAGAKAGSGVTVRVLGEAPKQAPDARAAEIGERIAEIDTQLGARAAAEQAAATQEGKLTGHLAEAEVLARRLTQYIDGNPGAGPASLASIGLGRHDLPTSFDEHGWAQHGSRHWAPENNRPRVEQQRPELRAPADTAAPTRSNTADRQTRVWFTKVLIPASLVLARIIAPHPATIPAELAMLHSEPTISTRTSLGGDPAAGGKIVIVEQAKAPPSAGAEPEVTRSSEAPGSGSGGPSDAGLADQPIWLWRDRLISAATLNPDEELGGTPHFDAFGRTESAAQRLPAPGIDAVTWAQYGPAQRAEAWDRHADSVRDAAQAAEQRIQQLR
ncbi:MAG: hypothetical protein QOD96_7164, partial [Pseudonocardiales bacterium]|nr:hypothetical protein [Pseudonocardiales bacterium]